MSNENQKDNKENFLTKFLKAIHEYYIFSFIFLFALSIIIFAIIYFLHSKNIENRFNNTLQNYEKSMSAIFSNMIITNGNNENINTNSFQTNNIENLKLSFEVGFKMLESSMNEIMKNSNDILQFWFAFLSVIMIVFTLTNNFINNSIFKQAKENLNDLQNKYKFFIKNINKKNNKALKLIKNIETEAKNSIDKIKIEAKNETNKLIEESNKKIQEYNLFNLSNQAYYNKDYRLAIYYAKEAIKLNNKNFALYNNVGFAKYNLANSEIENKDKYNKVIKETIKYYNKAIKLNSNYSMAYNNRGISKAKLKMYEEAIKDFNKAIGLNPNYSEAYNNNGISKAKLKMYEEAIKDYNKAIELNPNFEGAYFNRGISKSDLSILIKKENKIEEYNKLFNESYNDFKTAYSFANNELKKELINRIIVLAQNNDEVAIKFCEEYNINYNDNKLKVKNYD